MSEDAELPQVTDELLAGMEWRYAVPRCCRVCGAPLQLSDWLGMKMRCTSAAASPIPGKHKVAGATWQEALHHWENSTLYDPPDGDLRVLALAAAFREVKKTLEAALFLRQNGERPPGGNETWHNWDLEAEKLLRSFLAPEENGEEE